MRAWAYGTCFVLLAVSQTGCARLWTKSKVNYQTVQANPHRDSELAEAKTAEGAKHLEKGRFEKAEAALQEALVADVTYGPAHNNLGTLYFQQQKFYLAAWEYEYAIRVMPERAEPFNNLGLVYEAAEKHDRALEMFEAARRLEPNNPEYLGNLTRTLIRRDGPSAEARLLLEDLVFYDTRPEWTAWAREQLAVGKHPEPPSTAATTLELLPAAPRMPAEAIPLPSAELPPPRPAIESSDELPSIGVNDDPLPLPPADDEAI